MAACNSDDEGDQLATDIALIKQYLADRSLTAIETESGLHYIITTEGSGNHPTLASNVEARYKGYFLDGRIFDQTMGSATAEFPLSAVILGWQEGIPKFKKGGAGVLLIPSRLAYGPGGRPGIPGNTVLIFDIELVDF
jgi:FKBP-type peptidyl-prolyl cis-trans isomerase FkpA